LSILAGSFTVRIELVSGGRTRLDYISFDELPESGIEDGGGTWGAIKALYR
jgi:hypothetical protein